MSNNYGLSKYKQTSVTTASRGKLLLMLYESCMKYCKLAIEATERKKPADKGKYILKTQDIINELALTLDHKVGGGISVELERLYNFMIEQLTEANIKNDTKPLTIVLQLLETLYEGWSAAVQKVAQNGGDPSVLAVAENGKGAQTAPQSGQRSGTASASPSGNLAGADTSIKAGAASNSGTENNGNT